MHSFPFLRLSQSAQQEIILNMNHYERLALSVCSEKAKTAVKNSKSNLAELTINFGNRLQIELLFGDESKLEMAFMDVQFEGLRQLDRPQTVQFLSQGNRVLAEWRRLNLGFDVWIRHLLTVYSGKKLTNCEFDWQNEHYDVGSIKKCLDGIKIKSIQYFNILSEQNFHLLLNSEILTECVTISDNGYENESGLRKVLSQNLSVFYSIDHFPTYFSCLHNILSINSLTVYLEGISLSDKDLNQFLKLWKTGSMPRLEYLRLSLNQNRDISKNVVFKGVRHVVIERSHVRHVTVENTTGQRVVDIRGGYDVTRVDGVKATIRILESSLHFYLLK